VRGVVDNPGGVVDGVGCIFLGPVRVLGCSLYLVTDAVRRVDADSEPALVAVLLALAQQ
jgi:hypothetical protein